MTPALLIVLLFQNPPAPVFDLAGHVTPEGEASISLYGATTPFSARAVSSPDGRFRFRKLRAGTYTLGVYFPELGEARQTVEVGPGTADSQGRVMLTLNFKESDFEFAAAKQGVAVSVSHLAIPPKAFSEYEAAGKDLGKHDVDSAVGHLQKAVKLAPQFSAAWNELGTIAYQTRQYPRAEECFREALVHDPEMFEALVNLGGALLTEGKLQEALMFNQIAVRKRPNDALANSQLGQTHFGLGNLDAAIGYLEAAAKTDPSHFSHPQLVLAEIHLRRGENQAAAADLEDFLAHHPDYPGAERIRGNIARLKQQ
jgi:tetratricopeptide (TPR) repeat protein